MKKTITIILILLLGLLGFFYIRKQLFNNASQQLMVLSGELSETFPLIQKNIDDSNMPELQVNITKAQTTLDKFTALVKKSENLGSDSEDLLYRAKTLEKGLDLMDEGVRTNDVNLLQQGAALVSSVE